MARKEYKFNTQTLTYEVITAPFRIRFYRLLRKVLIGFILASIVNFLFSYFFYTPKMYKIERDNQELMMKYAVLRDKMDAASKKLTELKHRDNNVYRSLFAADTLYMPDVYNEYPASKYAALQDEPYSTLMTDTWKGLDKMARMLYLQSLSLDELETLSVDKEKMAFAVPAIWPIDRYKLRGHIGAFGGRNHPILGSYRQHTGIDLGADRGTPVYATGDGIVREVGNIHSGYGLQILLDHGYGYKTRYAHLSKIDVVAGQAVKRGTLIGLVGNTGRSTGPHLHYEVLYMNQPVNPINYFRADMDEAEFQRIIESAKDTTYETD
jgi:murein DD-endopeptidase MepM/ murein hydrolase activator NlpD